MLNPLVFYKKTKSSNKTSYNILFCCTEYSKLNFIKTNAYLLIFMFLTFQPLVQ